MMLFFVSVLVMTFISMSKREMHVMLGLVWFVALRPRQQLWSCGGGQFT